MHQKTLFLIVAMALVAAPQFALADGDGALTGVVGGAVAGVVGGVAGGVIGNGVSVRFPPRVDDRPPDSLRPYFVETTLNKWA